MPTYNFSEAQIQWIDDFVQTYMRRILNILYMRVKDQILAEDLLQDVLIKVMNHIDKLMSLDDEALIYYIRSIVRTVIIDYYRKDQGIIVQETDLDDIEVRYDAYKDPESHILDQNWKELLNQLPQRYKELMIMRICYDMSFAQIGAYMDIKENTARKWFERAKKKLLEYYGDDYLYNYLKFAM